MDPLSALAVSAGSQALGAGLGKLLGRMNQIDPNKAYQNAPQYQEIAPELDQSYQERAMINNLVDNRRGATLARLMAQLDSTPPMSANSARNVAQANAQSAQAMNVIGNVEANLTDYKDTLDQRASIMQARGRSKLADIMNQNAMARQQARQNAELANQQLQASSVATGMGLGQQLGSAFINQSNYKQGLAQQEKAQQTLTTQIGNMKTANDTMLNNFYDRINTTMNTDRDRLLQMLGPILSQLQQQYPDLNFD